jgi:hypothetical protein
MLCVALMNIFWLDSRELCKFKTYGYACWLGGIVLRSELCIFRRKRLQETGNFPEETSGAGRKFESLNPLHAELKLALDEGASRD